MSEGEYPRVHEPHEALSEKTARALDKALYQMENGLHEEGSGE